MSEDRARSEATFRFTVRQFSKLESNVFSSPCYVCNLPWKLLVKPKTNKSQGDQKPATRYLGMFLCCNNESTDSSWSCYAVYQIRLLKVYSGENSFSRTMHKIFNSKRNDWGYHEFIAWNDVLDPKNGYIKDDTITLEVYVNVPYGVQWDVAKYIGYNGLQFQHQPPLFINPLLQILYFTTSLRNSIYKTPSKSLTWELQRLFHELQFSHKSVEIKQVINALNRQILDPSKQYDLQYCLQVLFDKLQSEMKGSSLENIIKALFQGEMKSHIRCKNIDYTDRHSETFYGIQLKIKYKKNINEAFLDYISPKTLDGESRYDAKEHGLQVAEKSVTFTSFPPVLHLHLMRFEHDSIKCNDRFEFDDKINLDAYLEQKDAYKPANYILHAVVVNSGDKDSDHYVAFINPKGDGEWYKFNDEIVSKCSKEDAVERNYGDDEKEHCDSASMLVYIRNSELKDVLQESTDNSIPDELAYRIAEKKRVAPIITKKMNETQLYITINIYLEDAFDGHQGNDLINPNKAPCHTIKLNKTATIADLMDTLGDCFKCSSDEMRLWPFIKYSNNTFRPRALNLKNDLFMNVLEASERQTPWNIFLQLIPHDLPANVLHSYDYSKDNLIFFRMYDPQLKRLQYCGHYFLTKDSILTDMVPLLNIRAGFPADTILRFYEEIEPNTVKCIENLNQSLADVLYELKDGDIIVFEKEEGDDVSEPTTTCVEFFKKLIHCVEIRFADKMIPNDSGFTLELSLEMSYNQIAHAVAERIRTDAYSLQLFISGNYDPLRYTFKGTLKHLIAGSKPKMFYKQLSIRIYELENKIQFKCIYFESTMKETKELILYPNKNATIDGLLEIAKKEIDFSEGSTKQLRLTVVTGCKVVLGPQGDVSLADLLNSDQKTTYRIEEVPQEELHIADDELLVSCAHYCNDISPNFGIPFLIKIKQGEAFGAVKERIQKNMSLSAEQLEELKFAIVSNTQSNSLSLRDDDEEMNIADFKQQLQNYIGLKQQGVLAIYKVPSNQHCDKTVSGGLERLFAELQFLSGKQAEEKRCVILQQLRALETELDEERKQRSIANQKLEEQNEISQKSQHELKVERDELAASCRDAESKLATLTMDLDKSERARIAAEKQRDELHEKNSMLERTSSSNMEIFTTSLESLTQEVNKLKNKFSGSSSLDGSNDGLA